MARARGIPVAEGQTIGGIARNVEPILFRSMDTGLCLLLNP